MSEAPGSPHVTLDGYVVDENAINREIYGTHQVSSTQIRSLFSIMEPFSFPSRPHIQCLFKEGAPLVFVSLPHLLLAVWQMNSLSIYGP